MCPGHVRSRVVPREGLDRVSRAVNPSSHPRGGPRGLPPGEPTDHPLGHHRGYSTGDPLGRPPGSQRGHPPDGPVTYCPGYNHAHTVTVWAHCLAHSGCDLSVSPSLDSRTGGHATWITLTNIQGHAYTNCLEVYSSTSTHRSHSMYIFCG